MIRPLFSIGLLDRVFPGGVVIAQAALGILLGGRRDRPLNTPNVKKTDVSEHPEVFEHVGLLV